MAGGRSLWAAGRHKPAPPEPPALFGGLPLTAAVRARLDELDEHCRRGVLQLLADDYYDGLRPTETEILRTIDEVVLRHR